MISRIKVVFLDKDGVLVHSRTADKDNNTFVEPKAVYLLNKLTELTNCKFVLSSSIRILYPLDQIRTWWHERGLRVDLIDAIPQQSPPGLPHKRGHQIQAWLDAHPEAGTFAILDDEISDMEHLTPYVVKTEMFDGGLKGYHMRQVIDLLERT